MIKKILALLTIIVLVVGLMPLQLNADQDPVWNPPEPLDPPARLGLYPFYHDSNNSIGEIMVGPGDTFDVRMIIDQRLIDSGSLWNVNFDVDFPADQMTLVGINAYPYIVDPNTGTPINYTGVFVPNTSGHLQFHFSANPFDYDGNGAATHPFRQLLGTLTFQVKDYPDADHHSITLSNALAQDINGQATDFTFHHAYVNVLDQPVERLNISMAEPAYGAIPDEYIEYDDFTAYITWLELMPNGQLVDPTLYGGIFEMFEANTTYAADVFLEIVPESGIDPSRTLPVVNGEIVESLDYSEDGDSDPNIHFIKIFPPTGSGALPNLTGSISLSTLTPGFGDTNPIVATANSSLPFAEPFYYRWYRDGVLIPNSNSNVHSVVLADIGTRLRVEAYSNNYAGSISSLTTEIVTKGQQNVVPPVPAELMATADSITILNKQSDQEYGISTSDTAPTTWGFDDFNNLTANTDYYVFTRLAETPGLFPSEPVFTHIKTAKFEQVINGPDSEMIDTNTSLDLDTLYQSNVVDASLDYSVISNTADGTVLTDNVLQAGSTAGEVAIRIVAAEVADYAVAVKDVTIVVSGKMASQFAAGFSDSVDKHYGEASFIKAASLQVGDGEVSYSSDNPAVATVDTATGEVTIVGVGTANIMAQVAETDNYTSAQQSYLLNVLKANLVVNETPTALVDQGDPLTAATFSGGLVINETTGAEVAGTWHFDSTDIPAVDSTMLYDATFTPSDNADYYNALTEQLLPTIDVDDPIDDDDDDGDDGTVDDDDDGTVDDDDDGTVDDDDDGTVDDDDDGTVDDDDDGTVDDDDDGTVDDDDDGTVDDDDDGTVDDDDGTVDDDDDGTVDDDDDGTVDDDVDGTVDDDNDGTTDDNDGATDDNDGTTDDNDGTTDDNSDTPGNNNSTSDDDDDDDEDEDEDDETAPLPVRDYFPELDFDNFMSPDSEGKLVVAEDKVALITLQNGVALNLPTGSIIDSDGMITVTDGQPAQLASGDLLLELSENSVLLPDSTIPLGYQVMPSNPAADVPSNASYYDAVNFGMTHGIFKGTSEEQFLFSPEQPVDRAMFVTVLHRLAGNVQTDQAQVFNDVSTQDYYYQPVQWAVNNGLIEGYQNGLFGAKDLLTKEQMATIVYRFLQNNDKLKPTEFADGYLVDNGQISEYAKMAVNFCVRNGIVDSEFDGFFSPNKPVTRADAAVIIKNLIDYYVTVGE